MSEQHDKLVSQEAREAAGAFLRRDAMERGAHFSTADIAGRAVEQGEYDSDYLVQAFQRAMNQAAEAARADAFEEAAQVADEVLRLSTANFFELPPLNPNETLIMEAVVQTVQNVRIGIAEYIATAIRAKAVGNG